MAAQKGKSLLLKIGDGATSETFATVAGMRTTSLTINEETVDITNKSTSGQFRELLRAGVKSVSASGSGVFTDSSAEGDVRSDVFGSTLTNYQVVVPDFGTFEGAFLVATLSYAGEHNGEVTYDMTIESAGTITFSAS
ncbi:phage major tail protein, TP901-1 family [Pyruvatibacter mobilis]|uniref:phage major tail protein, TP901-1 family n=1 Tax=Pyruvatibacter mobilis TaxID=1712261 RepID=UPI003BAFD40B